MHLSLKDLFAFMLPGALCASLTPYTGPYNVGLVDIEVPVQNPRNITNTTFTSNGQPAWLLQTVLFSLYYPIALETVSTATPHPWTGNPVDCVAEGIVQYANVSSVTVSVISAAFNSLVGNVNIPAQADTPLVNGTSTLPVLIFSVGDITLRTWYSQYAGLLAANGIVTAIIEHRDGSLACSIVEEKGKPNQTVSYIQANQLSAPVSGNTTEMTLEQRSFRQAEVEETVRVLQSLNAGSGEQIHQNNSRSEGQHLSSFANRLDFDNLVMGGHSFGATLALQVLSDSTVPAKAGLAFDPGKMSGPLNNNFSQPVFMPDSEEWSLQPAEFYGQQHFDVVKGIAQTSLNRMGASWFMTLLGTAHVSITDAPELVGSTFLSFFDPASSNISLGNSGSNIMQYVTVTMEFFEFLRNGTRSGVLASGVTTPDFELLNPNATDVPGLFDGWEIHVAPEAGTNASMPTPSSTPESVATSMTYNGAAFVLVILATMVSFL